MFSRRKKKSKVKFERIEHVTVKTMNNGFKSISLKEYEKMQTFIGESSSTFWLVAYPYKSSYRPMVRFVKDWVKNFPNFSVPVFKNEEQAMMFLDYCFEHFEGTDRESSMDKLEVISVSMQYLKKIYKETYNIIEASGTTELEPVRLSLVMAWPTNEIYISDYPIETIDTNFFN